MHISDLHFEEPSRPDAKVVLDSFLEDVSTCILKHDLCPDFVAATGDIAFSGRPSGDPSLPSEYNQARTFFDRLLNRVGLSRDRFFVVPGNHDVDRSSISPGAAAVDAELTNRERTEKLWATPGDRRQVFARLDNYAAFVNDYLKPHVHLDDERPCYVRTLSLGGRRVAVLGLNSAWRCASDQDRGRLLLGEPQVRLALQLSSATDLRIALLHHPLEWLAEFDRDDSGALLLDHCDFVLQGHLHLNAITHVSSPDGLAMVLSAGAQYATRRFPNMYNWVRFDLETSVGTVYLRRYSDARGGFWTPDSQSYRNAPEGIYSFALHEPTAVPRPRTHASLAARQSIEATYLSELVLELDQWRGLGIHRPVHLARSYVPHSLQGAGGARPEAQVLRELVQGDSRRSDVLVEGRAGSGKTTLLKIWAIELAARPSRAPPADLVPIFLPLSFVEQHCALRSWEAPLVELAAGLYPDALGRPSPALTTLMAAAIDAGRAVLLLDGADEVPEGSRKPMRAWIERARRGARRCRFVLSSRPCDYVMGLEGFEPLSLQPFDRPQQTLFVRRWFEGAEAERDVAALGSAIDESPRLNAREIVGNPLFLAMICAQYESTGLLPTTVSSLIDQYTRLLLSYWDRERGIERPRLALDLKLSVLESVASYFLEAGYARFRQRALLERAQAHLRDLSSDVSAEEVIREIEETSGLLVSDRGGYSRFCHLLFQEYFAALHAVERVSVDQREVWRETHDRERRMENVVQFFEELLWERGGR